MLDFSNSKILIVGDVMLDKYYFGKVDRISPEAPVPIVNIQKEESRLGGASNVANNIVSLGGHSLLCGVIGHDLFGKEIERISRHKNIDTFLLKTSSPTITKARIIGGKQQIVRVDYEDKSELNADNKKLFRDTISRILPEQGFCRISRFVIVNYAYVEDIQKTSLIMEDSMRFNIPNGKVRRLRQEYIAYAREHERVL